jgi:hypothetical protein
VLAVQCDKTGLVNLLNSPRNRIFVAMVEARPLIDPSMTTRLAGTHPPRRGLDALVQSLRPFISREIRVAELNDRAFAAAWRLSQCGTGREQG